ncbi:hypothetical protein [Streptomyces sp. NPDC007206]|uniref:hypothetical protein n=1 Tax=Streptomyces sp. NPDC007206 TaxID=3154317 RepID=UPI0033C0928F
MEARQSFNAQVLEHFTDDVRGNGLAMVTGLVGACEGFGKEPSPGPLSSPPGRRCCSTPPSWAAAA